MGKRIAVVTDAISSDFLFQTWYRYYSQQFDASALYVVTYKGLAGRFSGHNLGGLIELPEDYNDRIRASFISNFVTGLLAVYDGVVRVDVDEMLVPRSVAGIPTLREFLERFEGAYLSARGFDVIASDQDASLDLERRILIDQRKFAYGNSTLNKVAYTTVSTNWLQGFHSCTLFPKFGDLFLFHLKFADTKVQFAWRETMIQSLGENSETELKKYYEPNAERLDAYRKGIVKRPVVFGYDGLYRAEHEDKFLELVRLDPVSRVYRAPQFHDTVLVELPDDLRGVF
jgi:hypothetical protein